MAIINPQLFTVESFPEQQTWIGKLFSPLNQFTGDVIKGFRNGLTVKDNLYQEIKELKFVNSTSNFPLRFTTKFASAPQGVLTMFIYNETLSTYSSTAPHFVWNYANNQVILNSVSGLTADNTYTVRFLIIYG